MVNQNDNETIRTIINSNSAPKLIASGVGVLAKIMGLFYGAFGLLALIIVTATGQISFIWLVLFITVGLIAVLIWCYNHSVRLKNAVKSSYGQLDNEYQRRAELIPNLVECVKDALGYENETLKEVIRLREKTEDATVSSSEKIKLEQRMSRSMMNVMALAEAYPQLNATTNIQQIKTLLTETEDRIAQKRDYLSMAIETYNSFIVSFPAILVAKPMNFTEYEMPSLNNKEELRQAQKVDLR